MKKKHKRRQARLVCIVPRCQRARNRVREHGNIMTLRKVRHMPQWGSGLSVFVRSLSGTWFGWFDPNEVTWEFVD